MGNWVYDDLGWWVDAIHTSFSHSLRVPRPHSGQELTGMSARQFMEGLKPFYEDTLRFLSKGTLMPLDARNLLFKAKALKKWRISDPSHAQIRREAALRGFVQRNSEAAHASLVPYPYGERMRRILREWLPEPERLGWQWTGRFGPKNVAEGWTIPQRYEQLAEWVAQGDIHWPDTPSSCDAAASSIARLSAVPKEYLKDRLITVEPAYSSFAQQYLREALLCSIHAGPLRGSAMDQYAVDGARRQRVLAKKASKNKVLATLDLSDASDRITWDQVRQVFPAWVCALMDTSRSPEYSYRLEKDGPTYVEPLAIYGGMGNASTFLVETLFFSAFVVAYASVNDLPRFISTFGDDIICNSETAKSLLREEFEFFRINKTKSFVGADSIRESCGIFAYEGTDITVPKIDGYPATDLGALGVADLHQRLIRISGESTSFGMHWEPPKKGCSGYGELAYHIAGRWQGLNVSWAVAGYPTICNPRLHFDVLFAEECENNGYNPQDWLDTREFVYVQLNAPTIELPSGSLPVTRRNLVELTRYCDKTPGLHNVKGTKPLTAEAPNAARKCAHTVLIRYNRYYHRLEVKLPVLEQKVRYFPTDSKAAKAFNAPSPETWYQMALLGVLGRKDWAITSPDSRRAWSVAVPVPGAVARHVRWCPVFESWDHLHRSNAVSGIVSDDDRKWGL